MDRINIDRPDTDDLFEWEVETSHPTRKTGNKVYMDVTGQARMPRGSSVDRIAPRLENLHLVGIFTPGDQRTEDITGRKQLLEEASGERPEFFYEEFFGEADVMTTPLELENMYKVSEEVAELERALETHPEFAHSNTRFGTGFDNMFIEAEDTAEALEQVDENIGFQILFNYMGDRQASREYKGYVDGVSILPETSEGVTSVYCAGRYDDPVVYTGGPPGLEVEMANVPELEEADVQHISEML